MFASKATPTYVTGCEIRTGRFGIVPGTAAPLFVSGCNFAVADTGSIVLVENEGNGRLCTTVPRVHIAVMGMERIVASWDQLDLLINLCRNALLLIQTAKSSKRFCSAKSGCEASTSLCQST